VVFRFLLCFVGGVLVGLGGGGGGGGGGGKLLVV